MAIAALLARSSTQYRAGKMGSALQCKSGAQRIGAVRSPIFPLPSGTWPAAPLAALPTSNDVPHRPAVGALPWLRLAGVAAHIQFEGRP